MTFDINRSTLSHTDAETLHAALKLAKHRIGVEEVLFVRPEMTIGQAEALLVSASHAGLLEVSEPFYAITSDSLSFLKLGVQPRFDRLHADKVISKAIAAARKWNKNQANPAVITELRLFGSTLGEGNSFGDVDIEVRTESRSISAEKMAAQVAALPVSVTRTYEGYAFPEVMVKHRSVTSARGAINRSAKEVIACHEGTIDNIGADYKQIYRYDPKQEVEIAAENIHHPRSAPRTNFEDDDVVTVSQIMPPVVSPIPPAGPFWTSRMGKLADRYWRGTSSAASGRRACTSEEVGYYSSYMSEMAWLEGCPAWPLKATHPADALHELQRLGQEIGALSEGDLCFHVDGKNISVEFPHHKGAGTSLLVSAQVNGKKSDLNLIPMLVPARRGQDADDFPSMQASPEQVSIARSAGPHLMAIYRMIAPAAALKMKLSFVLSGDAGQIKLPRLTQMMNSLKAHKVELLKQDFEEGLAMAKEYTFDRTIAMLTVNQTLVVDVIYGDPYMADSSTGEYLELSSQEVLKAGAEFQSMKICEGLYDWEAKVEHMKGTLEQLALATKSFHLQLARENSKDIYLDSQDRELPEVLAGHKGVILRDQDEALYQEAQAISA